MRLEFIFAADILLIMLAVYGIIIVLHFLEKAIFENFLYIEK